MPSIGLRGKGGIVYIIIVKQEIAHKGQSRYKRNNNKYTAIDRQGLAGI